MAELHAFRIAAVLAADAHLQLRSCLAAFLDTNLDAAGALAKK